ncbi:reverse transcriptase family protein [Agrobacterium tumefaciens]|uniref:reverse transcriptase family protein n=1 Tax=Agrobacterium tumefaciens TaxID=358 RepID=UPI001573164A|nr:RNA-directed DNA polymerase [Agrobacterium tumefaciens]
MHRKKIRDRFERYELARSPFSQKPTQRDIAKLLGESRDDLRRLIDYKEQFIVRRQEVIGKKQKLRDLRYPVSRLRAVHERLKFHLNKVKLPSYLFSPRRNRGQRDNAALHLDQDRYLTLDLKQFYPSTTARMVWKWFRDDLGMYDDVAGMLTHLCTIDEKVSFGSPLTPVLCALIHRPMFDRIAEICDENGLRYSLWVDDLTISGPSISVNVLKKIRAVVQEAGLKTHKIKFHSGKKPVFITGVGVVGAHLVAANSVNLRLGAAWAEYDCAETLDERDQCTQTLLSLLGTVRHIVGAKTEAGQKAANQMNSLRQKLKKHRLHDAKLHAAKRHIAAASQTNKEAADAPF